MTNYDLGFIEKCAEYNISFNELIKLAGGCSGGGCRVGTGSGARSVSIARTPQTGSLGGFVDAEKQYKAVGLDPNILVGKPGWPGTNAVPSVSTNTVPIKK